MTLALTAIVAGLGVGAVYGLVALGYTVTYNATGLFNFAQGQLVLCGLFLTYLFVAVLEWPQLVAFVLVMLAVPLIALVEERIAVRTFLRKQGEPVGAFISTLGFGLILTTIVVVAYGDEPVKAIPTFLPTDALSVGGINISPKTLFAVAGLLVAATVIVVFYRRTWLGIALQATASDRELAAMRGIPPTSMSRLAFGAGGLMAAFGGFAVAPILNADVTAGITFTLLGFVALTIGGFGSIPGSIVGALVLGVAEQLFGLYVDASYTIVADLILLSLILCIRPAGLFSSVEARRV